MSAPLASIVVPAKDAADTIGDCLRALREQAYPADRFEVIVVDDGSTDETARIASATADTLIRQEHRGPAFARNAGARAARGEALVFTDADCSPAPSFLEELLGVFEDDEVVAARGVYRTHQRGLVPRFVQQEYEHKYMRARRLPAIDFIDTYAAAYRKDVFLENEGFDTTYPSASVEDQEFSFRLARKGYRMVFVPSAVVFHRHDRSLGEYLRRKFWIGYWKAYLLRRHPEKWSSDSHTPPAQRLQVLLAMLTLVLLAASPILTSAVWPAILGVALLAVSAVPELISIARGDPPILAIAPLMIVLRALALGAGLAMGSVFTRGRGGSIASSPGLWQRAAKRAIDVVLSSLGLLLTAPLLLAAALAIRADSPGPVFFAQERVGLGGRKFRMLKLRTMVPEAETHLEAVLAMSALSGPAFKIPDDPRVTRVGRILRRWSIDELPQLWNVLRGEMSLVGPRPEEVRVVAQYSDWHRRRLEVPPGLTGPMQVSGRGALDLDARVRLELDYISNYSLRRDLVILAQTFPAVLSGKGAL